MTQAALLTTCIFWKIFCSTPWSSYKRHFCLPFYAGTLRRQNPLPQVSFDEWQTTTVPTENYHFFSYYSTSFPDCLNVFIRAEKYHQGRGNTLCWEKIQSLANLSSTLTYSIVSLVFCKFSYRTYWNGLNRGTSKLRYFKCFKKYETC